MLNYHTPLTEEESNFAAAHHSVIFAYLKKAGLSFDDFYDIAVFGYLRAVRKYLARPELQVYQFSTIAFRAMSCDVHHSREYWKRAKRFGHALYEFKDDVFAEASCDSVAEAVDNVIMFEEFASRLTPLQQRIAELRDAGYRDREIAAICGIGRERIAVELETAQRQVLEFRADEAWEAA